MVHRSKITSKSPIDLLPGSQVSIMRPTLALPRQVGAKSKLQKKWRLQFDGTSVDVSRHTAVPRDQKLPSGHWR